LSGDRPGDESRETRAAAANIGLPGCVVPSSETPIAGVNTSTISTFGGGVLIRARFTCPPSADRRRAATTRHSTWGCDDLFDWLAYSSGFRIGAEMAPCAAQRCPVCITPLEVPTPVATATMGPICRSARGSLADATSVAVRTAVAGDAGSAIAGGAGAISAPIRLNRTSTASLVEQIIRNPMLNGAVLRLDGGLRMAGK